MADDAEPSQQKLLVLRIDPARLLMWLLVMVAILALGGLFVNNAYLFIGSDGVREFEPLLRQFQLDAEHNLPTWVASGLLLLNGCLLVCIGGTARAASDTDWPYWTALGLIFFVLSLDEFVSAHEAMGRALQGAGDFRGAFHYAWVIPVGLGLLVLGAIYLRFFLRLPMRTRLLILGSAALYIGGALGAEMVGGAMVSAEGWSPRYALTTWIEETLELAGQVLFTYALLDFAVRRFAPLAAR
ncbi:hypothetical protein DRV85_18465 [Rhodosalinus halophilus]|uniref:Uncharacterized protein n=1 Tax=Rhodosalinus halophilus TaxID=2259333 RepID=A0A365U5E3_9RHOB|nr:hypothetical protein [Rhodosalinus halophilus]RBI82601.1 hypothetical protein DRV85_18465 [Rhodosalinus halophilus]